MRWTAEESRGNKLRFRANESFDNVTEFILPSGSQHTVNRLMETPIPADFATHPGCLRNMSYEAVHAEVLARNEVLS